MRRWFVDGNNVMGSRPDRWWNDRPAAQARLAQQVAEWCRGHAEPVVLVFDGAPVPAVTALGGGNLRVEYAPRRARNGADDHLVDLVVRRPDGASLETVVPAMTTTVVTADRGLVARLPAGTEIVGPRSFLETVSPGASEGGPPRR